MFDFLNIAADPMRSVLPALLRDKTTGRNIVWGTDSYAGLNAACQANAQITEDALLTLNAFELQPRCMKAKEEQLSRTRSKAEVFTPSWICNQMNNVCDEDWFGVKAVFNREDGQTWINVTAPVAFPEGKDWKQYVDSRRLEITCGEAPFIASRYDTSTGDLIPTPMRVGILDRKLRVVKEDGLTGTVPFAMIEAGVKQTEQLSFRGCSSMMNRLRRKRWFPRPASYATGGREGRCCTTT